MLQTTQKTTLERALFRLTTLAENPLEFLQFNCFPHSPPHLLWGEQRDEKSGV